MQCKDRLRLFFVISVVVLVTQVSILLYFLHRTVGLMRLNRYNPYEIRPRDHIQKNTHVIERLGHRCNISQAAQQNKTYLIKNYIRDKTFISPGKVGELRKVGPFRKRILTWLHSPGRLGNKMFSFASYIGTAYSRNMEPQLFGKNCDVFTDIFTSRVPCNDELIEEYPDLQRYVTSGIASYDPCVQTLSNSNKEPPFGLAGYMQSWKYFHQYRDSVSNHFKFVHEVIEVREIEIGRMLEELSIKQGKDIYLSDVILVGVHVRRQDMTWKMNREKGYVSAPVEYIGRAMELMESILQVQNILYVIVSDDIEWCKINIKFNGRLVTYVTSGRPEYDLAMLARCEHVVITSGTFGWWGAYLAGGTVIYFSGYPRVGSEISNVTIKSDYYPPAWIGIE